MAFLLPVVPKERVASMMTGIGLAGKGPIVGIVTRMFFWESANNGHSEGYRANQYYDFVARFNDWIISRFDVQICLVPMETGSGTYWNDEAICLEIYNRMVQKDSVKIAPANLSPPEVKGLLNCFELVVSWKLHGAVIATSCAVPTIALSYGEKFKSLFNEHLRLPELIINLNSYGYDDLFSHLQDTFESTWQNRERFRVRLRDRTEVLSKLALSYSKQVCQIINKSNQLHDT
jgi:polysaccharide pyruvyl transferase WcaK-like protein